MPHIVLNFQPVFGYTDTQKNVDGSGNLKITLEGYSKKTS